ncbi:DNA-binding response regulator [Clostridia bacterium]|nr:DNA-binding response regulator [Clostridia bacterium]
MLSIAICDDDSDFAQRFGTVLRADFADHQISCRIDMFESAPALLHIIEQEYYDIICLDIEIGDANGIEIGNHIRDKLGNQKTQIVFVSSYDSYHQEGKLYGSAPMAFIRKPFQQSHIDEVVSRTIKRILPTQKEYAADDYFLLDFNRKKYRILMDHITYIECVLRRKCIHIEGGREYTFNSSMRRILTAICRPDFIQIHQSFVVNARYIEKIDNSEVVICKTGQRLPVSATYYANALKGVADFLERENRR